MIEPTIILMKTIINIESYEQFIEYCRAHLETLPNDLFLKNNRDKVLEDLMMCRSVIIGGEKINVPYFITKYDVKTNTEKYKLFKDCSNV
jgi:hypothetical protein